MISAVKILDPQFKKRIGLDRIEFKTGINLLIGENGCGKSSLLHLINEEVKNPQGKKCRLIRDTEVQVDFYSSDIATQEYTEKSSSIISDNSISHGQRLNRYIEALKHIEGERTILADEIEVALDFDTIYNLGKYLSESNPDIQWIIATHSPILFTLKGVNIINMSKDPNYLKSCLKRMKKRFG